MSRYAAMAQRHWKRYAPLRFAQIENPEAFFQALSDQAEREIAAKAEQILTATPTSENFVRNVGRTQEARQTAESEVLREMVLIPAEPGTAEDEESSEPPASRQLSSEWMPVSQDLPPSQ